MKNTAEPNPRAAGFNYGLGWGSAPKPPIYYEAMDEARRLRNKSAETSRKSWEMDMVLRDVRLAETDEEKAKALMRLTDLMQIKK